MEKLHWDLPTAQGSALGNTTIGASDVLRYCLAEVWEIDRLMKLFLPRAICEYAFERRSFDAAWGIMITDNLRCEAEQLVPQIRNENTTIESDQP
jgi:hypothetical protein